MAGLASALALVLILGLSSSFSVVQATPLDDYVNAPDPTYTWNIHNEIQGVGWTAYVLNLTSQQWLTPEDSSRPIWTHWLVVCVPDIINKNNDKAFLYINDGSWYNSAPTTLDPLIEIICLASESVAAELHGIPNEPITFADGISRTEDAIIAYTWWHFLHNTSAPDWLLRLPMTKAAVKAMDTIQALQAQNSHVPTINQFVVAGASKRGWTTWTTMAVDPRVAAGIPIVIPILNIVPNLNHQWQAYGGWSFALEDYLAMNVTTFLNTEQFLEMAAIIDPFSYLDRLTMPKLLICATGDEFFLPDSPQFFFSKLQGPTWLRMIANGEHTLSGHQYDLAVAVTEFYRAQITGVQLPQLSWEIDNSTGAITLYTPEGVEPSDVRMWHATNPTKRDFRLITCADPYNVSCLNAILWMPKKIESSGNGVYVAEMPMPKSGWTGFFLEVTYKFGGLSDIDPMAFTTEVSIIPQTLPYPPCGDHCGLLSSQEILAQHNQLEEQKTKATTIAQ